MRRSRGRKRVGDLGLALGSYTRGDRNSISDVHGVRVGHITLPHGIALYGQSRIRTGVTTILPHDGNIFRKRPKAAYATMNGCGALLGALQIEEFGVLESPIALTSTMAVGTVATALVKYAMQQNPELGLDWDTTIPIVAECDDSFLNDARSLAVKEKHVFEALRNASNKVEEGAVGAGTGMTCFGFKGGIGTSSRILSQDDGGYAVGTLVLANFGVKKDLMVCGVPVGRELAEKSAKPSSQGSIVVVVATDAPLSSRQLKRVARRTFLGLARTGSCSYNGSGDIAIAFSTQNPVEYPPKNREIAERCLDDQYMNPIFKATVEATEEAILNALFVADTVVGRDGNVSPGLPVDSVLKILRKHGRL